MSDIQVSIRVVESFLFQLFKDLRMSEIEARENARKAIMELISKHLDAK